MILCLMSIIGLIVQVASLVAGLCGKVRDNGEKGCFRRICDRIKNLFLWNGYIRLTAQGSLFIIVFGVLQIRNPDLTTWMNKISMVIAIV